MRRWVWVVLSLVVLGVPLTGVLVASRMKTPEQAALDAAPPVASWVTSVVERRVLIARSVFRGEIIASDPVVIEPPRGSELAPIVTDTPKSVGDPIKEGDVLLAISGRPIIALGGASPMYRDIRPDANGSDVVQIQKALTRLGYATGRDPSGTYGPGTQQGIRLLYKKLGFEIISGNPNAASEMDDAEEQVRRAERNLANAKEALKLAESKDQTGQITQATLAVAGAERDLNLARSNARLSQEDVTAAEAGAAAELKRIQADPSATPAQVEAAQAALDQARRASERTKLEGDAAVAGAEDRLSLAKIAETEARAPITTTMESAAVDDAEMSLAQARRTLARTATNAAPTVPRGELVFIPSLPATVVSSSAVIGKAATGAGAAVGEGPQSAAALMTISVTASIVRGQLSAEVSKLLSVGDEVELFDSVNDITQKGKIVLIGDVPVRLSGGERGVAIDIQPETALKADQLGTNLRITVEAAATKTPVLVVPIAAVSSDASGTTRVSKLRGGQPVDVAVRAGLSADGFVAVEPRDPKALSRGDRVVIGIS